MIAGRAHVRERVGAPDADARQALELLRQARNPARATRDEDLGDRERARLALVELERGDELAGELLELAPDRRADCTRPADPGSRSIGVGLERGRELELEALPPA